MVPDGAQITGVTDTHVTWQQHSGFARDPYAHPEWAAGVWSAARAALLSTRMREDNLSVGALHLPPGSIVAFRTDAIYTTTEPAWPYHGQPGDCLLKGRIPEPTPAPTTDDFRAYHLNRCWPALSEPWPPGTIRPSEFAVAEIRVLALAGRGDGAEAVRLLRSAMDDRRPVDRFARPLYDLLARPEPIAGLEGLLEVWREIVAADTSAEGPWGGPDPA